MNSWLLKRVSWIPGPVAADRGSEFYISHGLAIVGLYIKSLRQKNLLESFFCPQHGRRPPSGKEPSG